jgi:hypothetical protein
MSMNRSRAESPVVSAMASSVYLKNGPNESVLIRQANRLRCLLPLEK